MSVRSSLLLSTHTSQTRPKGLLTQHLQQDCHSVVAIVSYIHNTQGITVYVGYFTALQVPLEEPADLYQQVPHSFAYVDDQRGRPEGHTAPHEVNRKCLQTAYKAIFTFRGERIRCILGRLQLHTNLDLLDKYGLYPCTLCLHFYSLCYMTYLLMSYVKLALSPGRGEGKRRPGEYCFSC